MAVEVADDKEIPVVDVKIGSVTEKKVADETTDLFLLKDEDLKKVKGLSPTFKKSMTRKFLRGTGDSESKQIVPFTIGNGYTMFDVISPPYNLNYLAELFEKSSPHAAAVKAKVKNIVGLGYDFVESDKTKEILDKATGDDKKLASIRRKLNRAKTELNDFLDSCNEEDSFSETLQKVWTDYEVTGNGYLEIGRKVNGQIGYIGHIPATSIRMRRLRDGFVQMVAGSSDLTYPTTNVQAVFFRNFGDKKTKDPIGGDPRPNEIIHFKKYTPTNGYYGVPDIVAALNAVAGNEYAARFNLDYFENKAVPRYVIVIKGATLSAQAEQNILEFFTASVKGKNHRTIYVPLPPDTTDGGKTSFEMKPVETGVQDASFDNYRMSNLNDILMAHGVPISKVSSTEDLALAAARDLDKTFKEQVCRPEQDVAEFKVGKIFKELTDVFKFKLNELSLTDEDTQSQIDERNIRSQTVTPNEVRARRGQPGLPGGDKVVVLSAQGRAEQTAQATGNRQRDQQRTANSTDSASSTRTRNEQGAGRQQS